MKKLLFITLILFAFVSCSLFDNGEIPGAIYILDWSQEAVFVIDSLYNVSNTPLFTVGTSPSDFVIYDEYVYVSNSGFGGDASVQKFSINGVEEANYIIEEATSPAGIAVDQNYVYVAQWADNSLLILNKEDLSFYKIISNLNGAYSLMLNNEILFIGTSTWGEPNNYVYILNTEDFTIDSLEIGPNPCSFAKGENEDIYISYIGNAFSSINGGIAKINNNRIINSIDLNSCPGKIAYINRMIYVSEGYYDADFNYISDVVSFNGEDLVQNNIYNLSSVSDIIEFRENIVFGTNSGYMYLLNLDDLESIDTLNANLFVVSIKTK